MGTSIKNAAFLLGASLSLALAQLRPVAPPLGFSATCYRHEPETRVLCMLELPPGGPVELTTTNTFYRHGDDSGFSKAFFNQFPLLNGSRSFQRITLQQRSRPQIIWVEFAVPFPSATRALALIRAASFEVRDIPLYVLPLSYSAPQGDQGDFSYRDETNFQLIDGERGVAPYTLSKAGNPPSYEWVGWYNRKVTLQFKLPSWTARVPIGKILIGTFTGKGGIEIPRSILVYDEGGSGAAFEVDPSGFAKETPVFLELVGTFRGPNIIIELEPVRGRSIFLDEVRFVLE